MLKYSNYEYVSFFNKTVLVINLSNDINAIPLNSWYDGYIELYTLIDDYKIDEILFIGEDYFIEKLDKYVKWIHKFYPELNVYFSHKV